MSRQAWGKKLEDAGVKAEGGTSFARASLRAGPTRSKPTGGAQSEPESVLALHLKANGVTGWIQQFRFHESRRWRADFAFPSRRLAIEIEGAIFGRVIEFRTPATVATVYGGRAGSSETRYEVGKRVTLAGGGHSRGEGMEKDMEKYNTLTLMGWRLLRFSPDAVRTGHAVEMIVNALKVCPVVETFAVQPDLLEGGDRDGEGEENRQEAVDGQAPEPTAGLLSTGE